MSEQARERRRRVAGERGSERREESSSSSSRRRSSSLSSSSRREERGEKREAQRLTGAGFGRRSGGDDSGRLALAVPSALALGCGRRSADCGLSERRERRREGEKGEERGERREERGMRDERETGRGSPACRGGIRPRTRHSPVVTASQ